MFKIDRKPKGRFEDLTGSKEIDEKFKWNNLIFKFVKELNMTIEEVYEMNYISSLNWLAFFDNRDKVIANNK